MGYVECINSPRIEDNIIFTLETYNEKGLLENPYTFERIFVYHIERSGIKSNERFLQIKEYNHDLEKIRDDLVLQGSASQLAAIEKTAEVKILPYSSAKLVLETPSPLWGPGIKGLINNVFDKEEPIKGKFIFLWLPKGMREGSYLIRWQWRNSKDGKINSAEKLFTLYPESEKINSIYRHFVHREKYNFLFDKYIPTMYRVQTTPNDITPQVLVKFNRSIAKFLLELDDLAVGLVDLISPTFIPDGFLPALANFFNIQLRSSQPTAWRNQIKNALPLFKKKGTLEGLKEALDAAGIKLLKLTNLWQVVSPYTWVDGFVIDKDIDNGIIGHLTKKPLPDANFEVSIKSAETKEYFILPSNIIVLQEIAVPEPQIAVIWNGDAQSEPIRLFSGDVIRVRYNYNKVSDDVKNIDNYIRNLPLADQRDETKIKCPLKNWNVKLIEEDDPFFDLLIPERHPFQNPVIFGKIRTTFLYSEKAFNMDTYNGSLYSSNNPCHLDKNFVDLCSGGQSSKFNVHLEFDQVTDEKIEEAKEIITDYSPFHAILHSMKISSRATDFVIPTERIKSEVKSKTSVGDKVGCVDAIYCQIKYKDGKIEDGMLA